MARHRTYRKMEWELSRRPDHLYALAYVASLAVMTSLALSYMPNATGKMTVRQLMDLTTFLDRAYRKLPEGYRKD